MIASTEVRLKDDACAAELEIRLEPKLRYFADPVPFSGAIRVHYPLVSQLDLTSVVVSPGSCVQSVRYQFSELAEFNERLPAAGARYQARTADLFKGLKGPKKSGLGDELYDVRADPGMLRNLAAHSEYRELARSSYSEIEKRWTARKWRHGSGAPVAEGATPSAGYTKDELELLRSLGYID